MNIISPNKIFLEKNSFKGISVNKKVREALINLKSEAKDKSEDKDNEELPFSIAVSCAILEVANNYKLTVEQKKEIKNAKVHEQFDTFKKIAKKINPSSNPQEGFDRNKKSKKTGIFQNWIKKIKKDTNLLKNLLENPTIAKLITPQKNNADSLEIQQAKTILATQNLARISQTLGFKIPENLTKKIVTKVETLKKSDITNNPPSTLLRDISANPQSGEGNFNTIPDFPTILSASEITPAKNLTQKENTFLRNNKSIVELHQNNFQKIISSYKLLDKEIMLEVMLSESKDFLEKIKASFNDEKTSKITSIENKVNANIKKLIEKLAILSQTQINKYKDKLGDNSTEKMIIVAEQTIEHLRSYIEEGILEISKIKEHTKSAINTIGKQKDFKLSKKEISTIKLYVEEELKTIKKIESKTSKSITSKSKGNLPPYMTPSMHDFLVSIITQKDSLDKKLSDEKIKVNELKETKNLINLKNRLAEKIHANDIKEQRTNPREKSVLEQNPLSLLLDELNYDEITIIVNNDELKQTPFLISLTPYLKAKKDIEDRNKDNFLLNLDAFKVFQQQFKDNLDYPLTDPEAGLLFILDQDKNHKNDPKKLIMQRLDGRPINNSSCFYLNNTEKSLSDMETITVTHKGAGGFHYERDGDPTSGTNNKCSLHAIFGTKTGSPQKYELQNPNKKIEELTTHLITLYNKVAIKSDGSNKTYEELYQERNSNKNIKTFLHLFDYFKQVMILNIEAIHMHNVLTSTRTQKK